MKFKEIKLSGAFVIEIEKKEDDRGFFARTWCQNEFKAHGLNILSVQANTGYNRKKGTLRGLHYQVAPNQETKLIRCIKGKVFEVMIDLRPDSTTYKEWFGIELTEDDTNMVFVPENFARGYLTLSDNTEVLYQVSQFYAPESEKGIRWNDPAFGIKWPLTDGLTISEKDKSWTLFS